MRYPNLRYGNPGEFQHYAMVMPLKELARYLKRDERTVKDWLSGRRRVPWWVPEILRLKQFEVHIMIRRMGYTRSNNAVVGIVRDGGKVELAAAATHPVQKRKPQGPPMTALRLDDFNIPERDPIRTLKSG